MASNLKFEQKLPGLHKVFGMALPLSQEFMPMITVEAFSKTLAIHPDWILKIIGYGNLFSEIQTYIKSRSLQNSIMLYGPLDGSEIYDVLKRSDILLLPSDNDSDSLYKNTLTLGIPVIVHEKHRLKDYMKMDNGLVPYDGTLEHMAVCMDDTIKNIEKFDAAILRAKRLEYNIVNI